MRKRLSLISLFAILAMPPFLYPPLIEAEHVREYKEMVEIPG